MIKSVRKDRLRRKKRNRYAIAQVNKGKPRLSVFRSHKYIYAQLIADDQAQTLACASSLQQDVKKELSAEGVNSFGGKKPANLVGQKIAAKALQLGVKEVVFDRGCYLYHGVVRELAEAARKAGLSF